MDHVMLGLDGPLSKCLAYVDDLIVFEASLNECNKKKRAVLNYLEVFDYC
jgi:hypothetical protein